MNIVRKLEQLEKRVEILEKSNATKQGSSVAGETPIPTLEKRLKALVKEASSSPQKEAAAVEKDNSQVLRIGIDFGGVLSQLDGSEKHDQGQQHTNIKVDMPDAISVLKKWKSQGYELYLISHCGKARAQQTSRELKDCLLLDMFKEIYFTKTRDAKAAVIRHLGCHLMIDDRQDVLDEIARANPHTVNYLFDGSVIGAWKFLDVWLNKSSFDEKIVVPHPNPKISSLLYLVCETIF
jgi:FMN phosphatase YigB (HAD superfamily)